jgi:methionyl-tRNA formyltransferase
MGTPELACTTLAALLEAPGFNIVAVVTQPDRPKGRDLRLQPSPVKELANQKGLRLVQPEKARDEKFLGSIRELRPDLIAVAAFGQILPQQLLNLPRFGCLNVHTSLLPKYRGAAPIQWAILNDDRQTGVTIMKMDAGLDTGPILSQESTPIEQTDTSPSLHDRLASLGANLLVRTIPDYVSGRIDAQPQPVEGVSYARKILKTDGLITWKRPARDIWNQARALVPWPGAYSSLNAPRSGLLKIWEAEVSDFAGAPGTVLSANKTGIIVACGVQALRILCLQREGSRRLKPQEFLAGCPLNAGEQLGPID